MDRAQVLAAAVDAVRLARSMVDDVEFSCEDATRSDVAFVAEVVGAAIAEGATTINIPDTVGYTMPTEFQRYLVDLYERCPTLRDVTLSVHCHNDLGLAVANSLAGVQVGARQVEGCINGIGERAGNMSIEELAMILRTRADALGGLWCGIVTPEITRTSRLVSRMVGYPVQPNKAIVGRNAFAHEAGIHQHGVLSNPLTYEIMDVASVGLAESEIVLGKHSGRHALRNALEQLGYELDRDQLDQAFARFKEVADRKGRISAMDLEAIVGDEMRVEAEGTGYRLEELHFSGGTGGEPRARVVVRDPEGELREAEGGGRRPGRRPHEGHRRGRRHRRDAARVPRLGRRPAARTRWARPAWSATSTGAASRASPSRPTCSRRARSPTCARSTRAGTPSRASAWRRGCDGGPHAVPEGLGRPRGAPGRRRRGRRSCSSTSTWSTRSRRRRPSTACGWPAARCAAPTAPSPRSTTTCPTIGREAGRRRPALGGADRGARAQLRRVRHPAVLAPQHRARASSTSSARSWASPSPA